MDMQLEMARISAFMREHEEKWIHKAMSSHPKKKEEMLKDLANHYRQVDSNA